MLQLLSSKHQSLTQQFITNFKKAYKEGKRKGADLSERITMKNKVGPT